jgi:hypothetical protein
LAVQPAQMVLIDVLEPNDGLGMHNRVRIQTIIWDIVRGARFNPPNVVAFSITGGLCFVNV